MANEWKDYQEKNKERFLNEMLELLRIPSVSAKTEHKNDMRTCAELVKKRLLDAGSDKAEVMETAGHPVVYGEKIVDATKPTVLVYGHYDVQPAEPLELWHSGPFEPVIKDGKVYVIEANPRASRTTPFIAKAYQIPYLNVATKVMLGEVKLKDLEFEKKLEGFAIKEPVFSFNKFPNVNKELGPEMKSTGEAIRFIKNLRDPYFRQLYKDRSMYLSK